MYTRTVTQASDGYELLMQFLSDNEYLQTHMHSVTFKAMFPLKPQTNTKTRIILCGVKLVIFIKCQNQSIVCTT